MAAGAERAQQEAQRDAGSNDRGAAESTSTGGVGGMRGSPMAKQLMRDAAREIVRGVFGVGRRR